MSAFIQFEARVVLHRRQDGERLPLLVGPDMTPMHYPTCMILEQRARTVAWSSLEVLTRGLLHLYLTVTFLGITDFEERLEVGSFPTVAEVAAIADLATVTTGRLRQLIAKTGNAKNADMTFAATDAVTKPLVNRRLKIYQQFFDLISRTAERNQSDTQKRSEQLAQRNRIHKILAGRRGPSRTSSIRGRHAPDELAQVVQFVVEGDPSLIWANPALRERNWALVSVLALCGLRSGELRQLRTTDFNSNRATLMVARRPDDPEDPRLREPNAKTADRIIPLFDPVLSRIEKYVYGSQADAAQKGSPFLFLAHSPGRFGQPISRSVVTDTVRSLGQHLRMPGLHPHSLRNAWAQNYASWADSVGVQAGEFDRYIKYLAGWSAKSQMATYYRGDQLIQTAYQKSLLLEEQRG